MSTKTTRSASLGEAVAASAPWSVLGDLGRQRFALATESVRAIFRGSEAMREVLPQAAHHSSVRHEAAAGKLRGSCAPADLLAIQSDLLRFDMQETVQYWQTMGETAVKAQLEMVGCASQMFNAGSGDGLKLALDAWQTAVAALNGGVTRPATP